MIRLRDLSKWDAYAYASTEHFLASEPPSGVHSITQNGQILDLLIENRGSVRTLVVFHGRLTHRNLTLPNFAGQRMAEKVGLNLISVSDPSLQMGDLDLAWYLGNRQIGSLRPLMSPLITHALQVMGNERPILFGSSGGGFAAANFAHDFPGAAVILANPRLSMQNSPKPDIVPYLKVSHWAAGPTAMIRLRRDFVLEKISDLIVGPLEHDLLVVQNRGDSVYMNHQLVPFAKEVGHDPRFRVRFVDLGSGHIGISGDIAANIVTAVARESGNSFSGAGFLPWAEALNTMDADG